MSSTQSQEKKKKSARPLNIYFLDHLQIKSSQPFPLKREIIVIMLYLLKFKVSEN